MTVYDKLTPTLREALALHDIIYTHGVPAEQVFVTGGEGKFYIVVRDSDKQFVIHVGEAPAEEAAFMLAWNEAVAAYNLSSTEERAKLLYESNARKNAAQIVAGLVLRGFKGQSAA